MVNSSNARSRRSGREAGRLGDFGFAALSVFVIVSVLVLSLPSFSENPVKIYSPVTDYAGVLSQSERANLSSQIKKIEETGSAKIAVYIEKSIPLGTSLEERSLQIAEGNGIGNEESDNGLLLYVAVGDRAYRWETGYGLEGDLSAAYLGRVSREKLAPAFGRGDYYSGISSSLKEFFGEGASDSKNPEGIGPIGNFFVFAISLAFLGIILLFLSSILLSLHFSALMLVSVLRRLFSGAPVDRAEFVYLFQSAVFSTGLLFPIGYALREYLIGFLAIVLLSLAFFVALPAFARIAVRSISRKENFWQGAEGAYLQDVSNGARMRKRSERNERQKTG